MPTPEQLRELQIALISAFPEKSSLEQLLFYELGKNLNQITQDSNLQTVVFELIKTAKSQGWLIDLVSAARRENPKNLQLEVIAFELLSPETKVKVIPQTSDDLITSKSPTETQKNWLLDDIKIDNGDDLSSYLSIDYTRLRDLLAAKNWKDADHETHLVMLKVVGRKKGDWIRDSELRNFPYIDLRTIDSLWVKYSNGRFGFSVQKKIYLEVGGVPDDNLRNREAWKKLGDRVGWRAKKHWIIDTYATFDTIVPVGHLPLPVYRIDGHLPYDRLVLVLLFCAIYSFALFFKDGNLSDFWRWRDCIWAFEGGLARLLALAGDGPLSSLSPGSATLLWHSDL